MKRKHKVEKRMKKEEEDEESSVTSSDSIDSYEEELRYEEERELLEKRNKRKRERKEDKEFEKTRYVPKYGYVAVNPKYDPHCWGEECENDPDDCKRLMLRSESLSQYMKRMKVLDKEKQEREHVNNLIEMATFRANATPLPFTLSMDELLAEYKKREHKRYFIPSLKFIGVNISRWSEKPDRVFYTFCMLQKEMYRVTFQAEILVTSQDKFETKTSKLFLVDYSTFDWYRGDERGYGGMEIVLNGVTHFDESEVPYMIKVFLGWVNEQVCVNYRATAATNPLFPIPPI